MFKKIINSLKFRLVALFTILTVFTSVITFTFISISAKNLRQAPPPEPNFNFISQPDISLHQEYALRIREDRQNQANQLLLLVLIIVAIQIFLASLGSAIIVRRSFAPLTKLNQTMNEINSLNLKSKIIIDNSSEEINLLINNFNEMMKRIQIMVEKEKEFLQNISHELKTPLTASRVNLESILITANLEAGDKADLIVAIKSLDSITKLIEDLTLLSKLNKDKLFSGKFDVISVLNEAINESLLVYKTHKPQIELKSVLSELKLSGSAVLFKRAIANLIENSIKYSIVSAQIQIELTNSPAGIKIKIADNGIGISAARLDSVFSRFYRVDESRSRLTGGSGLGLAITKEIIELFHGTIEVISILDKGTTFIIIIPTDS